MLRGCNALVTAVHFRYDDWVASPRWTSLTSIKFNVGSIRTLTHVSKLKDLLKQARMLTSLDLPLGYCDGWMLNSADVQSVLTTLPPSLRKLGLSVSPHMLEDGSVVKGIGLALQALPGLRKFTAMHAVKCSQGILACTSGLPGLCALDLPDFEHVPDELGSHLAALTGLRSLSVSMPSALGEQEKQEKV